MNTSLTFEVPVGWNAQKDIDYYEENTGDWNEGNSGCYTDCLEGIGKELFYFELALTYAYFYYCHKLHRPCRQWRSLNGSKKIAVLRDLIASYSQDPVYRSKLNASLDFCAQVLASSAILFEKYDANPESVWLYELIQAFDFISESYFFLIHDLIRENMDFRSVLAEIPI